MVEIRKQDYEVVEGFTEDIIDRYAEACEQPFGWDQFAFEALDNGKRVGAVVGYRLYDWLYVEFIAVTEAARGASAGSQLLTQVEALARELALKGVALDTFRYQAPDFYAARGYVERMVIPGKSRERDRIYLQKALQGN